LKKQIDLPFSSTLVNYSRFFVQQSVSLQKKIATLKIIAAMYAFFRLLKGIRKMLYKNADIATGKLLALKVLKE